MTLTAAVDDARRVLHLPRECIEVGVGPEPEEQLVEGARVDPGRPVVEQLDVVAGLAGNHGC